VFRFLPFPRRAGRRIVYIEGISLSAQSTGYASSLFRHYYRLFHDLGFHRFRLKASLTVGKYYWRKEGFDCEDRVQFGEMRENLLALVRRLGLPVEEQEVRRLNHANMVAAFRRDLAIPVYRNAMGITPPPDATHTEEFRFPSGRRSSSVPIRGTGTRSSTPIRRGAPVSSGRTGSWAMSRAPGTRRARNGSRRSEARSARRGCGKA